jgi:amino acid adenylation domain-containing protein
MNNQNPYTLKKVDFNPFADGEIESIVNPIEPQLEIWLSCKIGNADANNAYNESISIRLKGKLDQKAFEKAWQNVVSRHESLRSSFSKDGRKMFIYRSSPTSLDVEDLRSLPFEDQQKKLAAYHKEVVVTPFALEKNPLIRTRLFQLADDLHLFTFTAHHIICDGWSLGTIFEDLSLGYSAISKGIPPQYNSQSHFSQYAKEMAEYQVSQENIDTEKYWLQKFEQSIPQLDLPIDFPRPATRDYASQRDDYRIGIPLVEKIKKMGAKAGASFVTTFLVAYEVFVSKITQQNELVIGLPSAGQSATGHFSLVGHCVNLLPMRSTIRPSDSFLTHLKRRKSEILDDYDHQGLSFGSLLKKLAVKRDPSRVPLVPLVFNIDMGMNNNVRFDGIEHELISNPRYFETFEIFLNLSGSEEHLTLEWSYNTQLFKAESIKKMMDAFEDWLIQVTEDPEKAIEGFTLKGYTKSLSTPAAVEPPKQEPSASKKELDLTYDKDKPFWVYIHEIAQQYPTKEAVVFENQSIDYQNLDQRSNQVAHELSKQGVKAGTIVGVNMERSIDMVIALLGVSKAGGVYVPLDPYFPADRIAYMLEDSSAAFLLTQSSLKDRIDTPTPKLYFDQLYKDFEQHPTTLLHNRLSGDSEAYILYTSGSTGKPKGVQISHQNLINFLLSMQIEPGITAQDRIVALTTVSFDIAGLELYLPLITGATMLLTHAEISMDGRKLRTFIEERKASIVQATPATWRMLLDSGWQQALPIKVLCGGENFPKDLAHKLTGLSKEVWNMYGPTETTIWSLVKRIEPQVEQITIGHSIANTRTYILNEALQEVPIGEEGQIFIAGDGVAIGYKDRPELTAEKFVQDITHPEDRMYATGDLGKQLPNGEFVCLGRIDHQVKIRGYRIELGEIEHALTALHPIQNAVVTAREDRPGDQRLVAYLILAEEQISKEWIALWRKQLAKTLPGYMIPNDWVAVDSFPMTANNKIDRKALPAPDISFVQENDQKDKDGPLSANENLILEIWQKVFQNQQISVDDDFFEIGGHSLMAVDVMGQVEDQTGIKLPLASLFQHPTIRSLAKLIDQEAPIKWDCLVPIKPTGNKPPLYIVHGAGLNVMLFNTLTAHLDKEQPIYGLQAKGLNGDEEPFTSIKDMAGHYVSEIISQNPTGPYALSGFSLGGIIAYEMAQQMLAMGKEVHMLAMFDTFAHETDIHKPWYIKYPGRVSLLGMKFLHSLYLASKDPVDTVKYKWTSIKRIGTRLYWKMTGKEDNVVGFFGYMNKVDKINDQAMYEYIMKPIELDIHVFRALIHRFYAKDFKYLGWKKYAKKGVHIYDIPGEHNLIFAAPNDKDFGRILQGVLDKTYQEYLSKRAL